MIDDKRNIDLRSLTVHILLVAHVTVLKCSWIEIHMEYISSTSSLYIHHSSDRFSRISTIKLLINQFMSFHRRELRVESKVTVSNVAWNFMWSRSSSRCSRIEQNALQCGPRTGTTSCSGWGVRQQQQQQNSGTHARTLLPGHGGLASVHRQLLETVTTCPASCHTRPMYLCTFFSFQLDTFYF